MRAWLVGGAIVEGPDGLLLVRNRRRNGAHDWSPPGGVIDPGESVVDGLTREVAEETGLTVSSWIGPVYEIQAEAPDLGWTLRVEVHVAAQVSGELALEDPDGIVVDARYVSVADCSLHLVDAHPWVREPLATWLDERWPGNRHFGYHIAGTDLRSLQVTRVER
jgi:8-oxo-dGTP diphosphatase